MSNWLQFLHRDAVDSKSSTNAELLEEQDICLVEAPSDQSTVDLIPDWTSKLPGLGVKAGFADLFTDGRAEWAIQRLGGAVGKRVLELGPLEGGHTYILEKAGAEEIIAIEANKLCYMKCLIAKELLGTKKSRFLLGDFTQWLDKDKSKFDIGWVAGVLYHMDDPLRLLRQIGERVDSIYIWTHYIPDEPFEDEGIWTRTIMHVEDRIVDGITVPHYLKTYAQMGDKAAYCGGIYKTASWIRRGDILAHLTRLGFSNIEISLDVRDHQNGPCFQLVAKK